MYLQVPIYLQEITQRVKNKTSDNKYNVMAIFSHSFLFHKAQQINNKLLFFHDEHFKRDPVEHVSMTSLEPYGNYRNEACEVSTATANLRPAKLGFRQFYPTIKTDASNSWCSRRDCTRKATRKSCQ